MMNLRRLEGVINKALVILYHSVFSEPQLYLSSLRLIDFECRIDEAQNSEVASLALSIFILRLSHLCGDAICSSR